MFSSPWVLILLTLVAIPTGIVAVVYLIVPFFKAIGWVLKQVFRFVFGMIGDVLRLVGSIVTSLFFVPLVAVNVLIGRWSAASHFGRAFQAELKNIGGCLYRLAIGHPARLLCLTSLTDGLENRLPEAIAQAPTAERPAGVKARGRFEGYTIVGSLPGGGSGGRLYIAEPDALKRAALEREGFTGVRQVVIKTFSLDDGSSLPQIVRESRALEAAKKLGLVLDHELSNERFHYVMRYVPGDSLTLVTQRLHALSGPEGLSPTQLGLALGFAADLLQTLDTYHRGGLWHKDVKPDNIIVDGRAAHLVDFGLVTPLRSGMTLTTHGTEYFRDPEMVRMALKGVKVHQVDGARFDVYAAGAVLFSMVENSFPAHGGLSQISKGCPEALRWIVRRAMTDYDKRYGSAAAMLADLEVLRRSADPFAVKPAELPSMRASLGEDLPPMPAPEAAPAPVPPAPPAPIPVAMAPETPRPFAPQPEAAGPGRPSLRVVNWWSGRYEVDGARPAAPVAHGPAYAAGSPVPPGPRRPAHEQLAAARARMQDRRHRAQTRIAGRRGATSAYRPLNAGLFVASGLFLLFIIGTSSYFAAQRRGELAHRAEMAEREAALVAGHAAPDAPELPIPPAPPPAPRPRVMVNGVEVTDAAAPAPVAPRLDGVRLLVISDVQPVSPPIAGAIDRLREHGVELLGNYPNNPAPAEELNAQLELDADAKMVRGVRDLRAVELRSALSAWIQDGEAPVEGVLWFAPDFGKDGRYEGHYLLVMPGAKGALPTRESADRAVTIPRLIVYR